MTPNEKEAVRRHLSKSRPCDPQGCGCMGKRTVDPNETEATQIFKIKVTDFGTKPSGVAKVLRESFSLSLRTVSYGVAANLFITPNCGFSTVQHMIAKRLIEAGATVEYVVASPKLEPFCPCEMRWVEELDGVYYKITENRSVDGIEVVAKEIGPVGGPYITEDDK